MSDCDTKLQDEWRFWRREKARLTSEQQHLFGWLLHESAFVRAVLERAALKELNESSRILEIGAGPSGVINHWCGPHRYAIDPLADKFKDEFSDFLDPAVEYTLGFGEALPYENDWFDVVIIRNALDHVSDAHKVLAECFRVLKPNGLLYVMVHLYSPYGSLSYRIINCLTGRYVVEPWAFSWNCLARFLKSAGFRPQICMLEDGPEPKECQSLRSSAKSLAKKVMGLGYHKDFSCVSMSCKEALTSSPGVE